MDLAPSAKTLMMSSMYNLIFVRFIFFAIIAGLLGCGGPDAGTYEGKIGGKKQVIIRVNEDGSVVLEGYWQESLKGSHERGTLKGEDMDALVFEGPQNKKFKLRMLYQKEADDLIILAIQSRTYGPGSRYVTTEKDSVFDPPPRLSRKIDN